MKIPGKFAIHVMCGSGLSLNNNNPQLSLVNITSLNVHYGKSEADEGFRFRFRFHEARKNDAVIMTLIYLSAHWVV
jgi:hypothetical protein